LWDTDVQFYFTADVMQVANHYFENGIAHFTRRINKCISMACANGEVAPFVGHNAFLRWSALQDAAFEDPGDDNKKKIWSETNVSEDFDMALRLQVDSCPNWEAIQALIDACSSRDTSFDGRPIPKVDSKKVSR
jgi:hypothetical protein